MGQMHSQLPPERNEAGEGGRLDALIGRVDAFIHEVIVPFESDDRWGAHGPSDDMVAEMRRHAAKAGLIAPHLSLELGGLGLDHRDTARLFRSAGYSVLGPVAMNLAAPDEGNMYLLDKVATPDQRRQFLQPLAKGSIRSAFLMTEPAAENGAGSDPSMLATIASPDGDGWIISGRKTFGTGAPGADFAIVMARTGDAATMFLVDMNSAGVHIERVLDTLDGSMPGGHAVVYLDQVRVAADRILGEADKGFHYAQVRLAPARLTHCMRWWGAAKRAHDIASDYAFRRRAFGRQLIDHEGVGFQLADNLIDLKQAELIIDWCADVLDRGSDGIAESSLAKVGVSEALWRIADRCVQIMGGMGVTRDTVVERIFRETRAFRIYDGPSEVHRWSIAKRIKRELAGRGQ